MKTEILDSVLLLMCGINTGMMYFGKMNILCLLANSLKFNTERPEKMVG